MPHSTGFILSANALFAPLDEGSFDPGGHLDTIGDAVDIDAGAAALGLYEVLPPTDADLLRGFLAAVPASLHAAVLGALRSALSRGLRTQFTWQPGYDHELRIWEVSDETATGWDGLVNVFLTTPHPPEPASLS
jgi:hypothetical protein